MVVCWSHKPVVEVQLLLLHPNIKKHQYYFIDVFLFVKLKLRFIFK